MNNLKYKQIRELFEANQNPETAIPKAKYMRNKFAFYGIDAPLRKKLCRDFLKEEKKSGQIDWEFLNQCYEDDHREFQYLATDYLALMQKYLTYDDVPKLYKYVKTKQWWDTIDKLDRIIGNIGLNDNRIDSLMLDWSQNEDFWVRRVAIDHQLLRKERTKTELLEQIIANNFGSNEFFINKAIGWSLREYSKTNPKWVRNFLTRHKDKMASLSIREASKYI